MTEAEAPGERVVVRREIAASRERAATSEHESLVTVEFTELGEGRTEVTVTHDRFPPGHDSAPYGSGWEQGLEKLAALAERGEINA